MKSHDNLACPECRESMRHELGSNLDGGGWGHSQIGYDPTVWDLAAYVFIAIGILAAAVLIGRAL